jgi:hypothetical protein
MTYGTVKVPSGTCVGSDRLRLQLCDDMKFQIHTSHSESVVGTWVSYNVVLPVQDWDGGGVGGEGGGMEKGRGGGTKRGRKRDGGRGGNFVPKLCCSSLGVL